MAQNKSSAVMQQRHEPTDSFDYFPTPLWAARALCVFLSRLYNLENIDVVEPACGQGHMARALAEYFRSVSAFDIQSLGYGQQADYLWPDGDFSTDWTITNPPFKIADQFVLKALIQSRMGCAMFVRSAFTEGIKRHNELFIPHRPQFVLQFAERVIIHKGRVLDPSKKYFCEKSQKWKKPSTATSYSWVIWSKKHGNGRTEYDWIPPCRKELERPGDYDTAVLPLS